MHEIYAFSLDVLLLTLRWETDYFVIELPLFHRKKYVILLKLRVRFENVPDKT